MKIIVCKVENGLLTGDKKEIDEKDFKLDLKSCAKTYINGGVKIFVDSNYFNTL